jgi:PAS domain S-box-containing protein
MESGKAQVARLESDLFYDAFKASPIGIALEDIEGRPLFVNPALCSMLGYSEQELCSKHCVDFSPPEDAQKDWSLFEQLRKGLIDHYHIEKRYFRRDGSLVWGSLSISLLNGARSPMVIAMVEDITEKKKAEEALRESDQRFRLAAELGKMYSFEWDVATDVVVRSPERVKVVGATEPLRFSHQQFVNTIHPDDRSKFTTTIAGLTPENPTAEFIYRVQVADGGLLWLRSSGRAFFDDDGKMLRVIGMVADVTDLKRAEEALSNMAGKLIEAHEEERTRIARELHDDIGQRLAMLAWNLGTSRAYTSLTEIQEGIGKAIQEISGLDRDMRAVAYRLHSPRLEYLGLAGAASAYCSERSEQHNLEIDFQSDDIPKDLSREASLCLFRVLQEAIQNAIKHSGSQRFAVSFSLTPSGTICLTVQDSGIGFDPGEALKGRGLGLVGMKERLNLVGGELSIQSQPGTGTTIQANVPLVPRINAAHTK